MLRWLLSINSLIWHNLKPCFIRLLFDLSCAKSAERFLWRANNFIPSAWCTWFRSRYKAAIFISCSVPRVWSSCCLSRVDHWSFAHMMILFVSKFLSEMSDSHWGDLRVSKSECDGASEDDPGDVPEGEACSSVLVREGIFTTRWFLGRLVASQWWIMVKLGIPVAKAVYHLWQPYILQTGNSNTSVPGKAWKSYNWYSGPMTI